MRSPNAPLRVVVLASGAGTNFEALARALAAGGIAAAVVALVTDHPEAPCAGRAAALGVPLLALPARGLGRAEYDRILADRVEELEPDLVLLLGWMRLLSPAFLSRFPGRVTNLHPALPGAFPGTEAIRRAWEAAGRGEIDRTGVMLHLVPDEGVDSGPLIVAEELRIFPGEPLHGFEERVHAVERRLVIDLVARLAGSRESALPDTSPAQGA